MARGGSRPGAGRPTGAANKRTRDIANAAVAEGLTPLEYMLNILRDAERSDAERFEAAKQAAPYIHPRLSSVEADVKAELSYEERLKRLAGG
jgi:hypothetical protein